MTPWGFAVQQPALLWLAGAAGVVITARLVWLGLVTRQHSRGGQLVHIAAPPEVDARGAAMLWSHLVGVSAPWWRRRWCGQPHLVWEFAWSGRVLDVRIWVPAGVSAVLVERAVTAAWPGSACSITPADAPLVPGGTTTGGALSFGPDSTPLRTDHTLEPLRALIAAADDAAANESAIVQILARPAAPWRIARLRRSTAGPPNASSIASMIVDLLSPHTSHKGRPHHGRVPSRHLGREDVQRCRGAMYEIGVRYAVAVAGTTTPTTRTRDVLQARAHRIASAMSVLAGPAGLRRHRLPGAARLVNARWFTAGGGRLVSVDEIAALAHLPADDTMPQLARAGARPIAPVAAVPSGGRHTKPLGTSAVTGRRIALPAADSRHHVHIVGSTGGGKSTLMTHMVLSDIRDRRGVVVIDPKGDLVTDILDRLDPQAIAGRLHIIDPDQTHGAGIDPLAGDDADLTVDHFVGICRRIWERHWGPRADDILRSALLTLLTGHHPSLEALAPLLSNKQQRSEITAQMQGPLAGFWEWYDSLPAGVQSQAVGPVLSRIRALMTRKFVRDTIGAPHSDINMRNILDNGGILLARLPKGQLGDDTARLLGSVIVARTWQATTARTTQPETRRRDASLYVDECHNFLTLPRSLDEILAEARGYKLSMVLAHQHMAQLPREMQFALSANARTKIFFTASPEDARLLARHTAPNLSEHDLSHLEAFTAACRLIVDKRELPAFTLATHPPTEPIGQQKAIRAVAAEATKDPVAVPVPDPLSDPVPDPVTDTAPHPPPPDWATHQHTGSGDS